MSRLTPPPRHAGPVLLGALFMAIAANAPNALGEACSDLQPEVRALLAGLADRGSGPDYRGVVTVQRGRDMQVVEVSRVVRDGVATERMQRLTGQDARVQRSGHAVDCQHPGLSLLAVGATGDEAMCRLAARYRFSVGQGEEVAGRPVVVLRAEPRDMYRFTHVFELDRDSSVLLRATTLSVEDRVLEQYQFASISLGEESGVNEPGERSRTSDVPDVEHEARHPLPGDSDSPTSQQAWQLGWLPEGFLPTDAVPDQSRRKSYSDGLASFSVFVEPLPPTLQPGEGVERRGSTVAYTRGMRLGAAPVLVTVLGEIPTNTARMLADAVRLP